MSIATNHTDTFRSDVGDLMCSYVCCAAMDSATCVTTTAVGLYVYTQREQYVVLHSTEYTRELRSRVYVCMYVGGWRRGVVVRAGGSWISSSSKSHGAPELSAELGLIGPVYHYQGHRHY